MFSYTSDGDWTYSKVRQEISQGGTVCPRSLEPYYRKWTKTSWAYSTVSYYIKRVTTSWTYGMLQSWYLLYVQEVVTRLKY